MDAIKRKSRVLAVLAGFGILMGVWLLAFGRGGCDMRLRVLPVGMTMAGAVAAGFWLRGLGRLNIARLIAENPILHIRTAVISDLSGRTARPEPDSAEVIISYFGILMGGRIIKFNQDGIRLRAVEIGGDFISLTYGTEERTQNIRLLRPAIDPAELNHIAEQFRYETGIAPTLLS